MTQFFILITATLTFISSCSKNPNANDDSNNLSSSLLPQDYCSEAGCTANPELDQISESEAHDPAPADPAPQEAQILSKLNISEPSTDFTKYDYIDPQHLIPTKPLQLALAHYDSRKASLKNTKYLGVVDFTRFSGLGRFYIINMSTGAVEQIPVAHGSGSDPKASGYAKRFSNEPGSKMSSLGLYLASETYHGKHGYSMRLDGLEPTNKNARSRSVVVHSANYVKRNSGAIGRSWGCLVIEKDLNARIINQFKNGSLIYTWYNQENI